MFDDTLNPLLTFNKYYLSIGLLLKCCNDNVHYIGRLCICECMSPNKNCNINK